MAGSLGGMATFTPGVTPNTSVGTSTNIHGTAADPSISSPTVSGSGFSGSGSAPTAMPSMAPAAGGAPAGGALPQGPTAANQGTGAFNTSYITPGTAAVHSIEGGPAYDQKVTAAYYGQQKQMLDPQWQQTQNDNEVKLANMGLSRGSEAWNRESDNLNRQKTMAYNTAQNSAIMAGGQESTRQQNAAIAAGNFANNANQQDFTNQVTSQNTQNAGLTAQQAAAQGWENFATQRANTNRSATATENAAASNAAGMTGAASIGASASMSNAQLNNDLNTRIQNSQEQQMNFNNARTQMYDPIQLQNLTMQGMYPTSAPTYAGGPNTTAAGPPTSDQSNYAAQIGASNNQAAGGIANAVGSLGGYVIGQASNPSGMGGSGGYGGVGRYTN